MTGTSAVLTLAAAPAGNAGKTLTGRNIDAVSSDDGDGTRAGFGELFASLAEAESGADCMRAAALAGSGRAVVDGFPVGDMASPKVPTIPAPPSTAASVALLASMRLNEALAPVSAPPPTEERGAQVLETAETTGGEQSGSLTEIATADAAQDASQSLQTPLPLWVWPQPQPQPQPQAHPLLKPATQPLAEGQKQSAADKGLPNSAPLDNGTIPKIESAANALVAAGSNPALVSPAAGVAVNAAVSVAVAAARLSGVTSIADADAQAVNERLGTPGAVGEGIGDPDAPLTSEISASSPQSDQTPRPQRAAPVASVGRTAAQPNPPQSAALAPPPVADDVPAPLSFASNLTIDPLTANNGERPASIEPAMLASARVATVHQETYFAPIAQQSPVEQVAERITDELAPAPRTAPAGTPDTQRDSGSPMVKVLHLQLNPPDLGPLTVRMTLKRQALDLQMEAGKQETAKLIDSDRDKLSGLLRAAGYAVDTLSIQAASRADGSAMNSGSGAFPQGQASGGWRPSQEGAADGRAWRHDGGDETFGENGKDGSDRNTTRTFGGAVYL